MPRVLKGNLFKSECQTLVNTVNCVGVMGAGIALEFRLRYPRMFDIYVQHCHEGRLTTGKLWLYKTPPSEGRHWVLNFPTKKHWKKPSQEAYLRAGLENFVETYKQRGIESIAFPILGSQNGNIPEDIALEIMTEYLHGIEIDVEIYRYDPQAEDDLYGDLKRELDQYSDADFAFRTGLQVGRASLLRQALQSPGLRTIGQLATQKGIGEKTLAKVFEALSAQSAKDEQTLIDFP